MRPAILRKFEAGSFKFGTDRPQTHRAFTNYSREIAHVIVYAYPNFNNRSSINRLRNLRFPM